MNNHTQHTIAPGVIVGQYVDRVPAEWTAIDVEPVGRKRTRITVMPPEGEALTLAMLAPVLDAVAARADVMLTMESGGDRVSIVVPSAYAPRLAQRLWRLCG